MKVLHGHSGTAGAQPLSPTTLEYFASYGAPHPAVTERDAAAPPPPGSLPLMPPSIGSSVEGAGWHDAAASAGALRAGPLTHLGLLAVRAMLSPETVLRR